MKLDDNVSSLVHGKFFILFQVLKLADFSMEQITAFWTLDMKCSMLRA